jgi:tripartite ATP-independent transporter DctP family solute receptor
MFLQSQSAMLFRTLTSAEIPMQRVTLQPAMPAKPVFRRLLASTLSAIAIAAFAWGTPAEAQSRTLKIGYLLTKDSQLGTGATAFAEEVSKRTGGRITIEQYPNAALGGEVEMMKAIQLGTLDMAFITGAPLPNVVPEVGVFNIPFIFKNAPHAHAVLDGPIGQGHLEKFKAKDMVALAWGENGMRHITNSKREIAKPEDLKGLKLRLPQSEVMLIGFKALGADPALLPFPQVYAALESGQFDGQENPIATIQSAKFAQVQKFLTVSGHVYDPAVFLVSIDTYDELSAEDKKAFAEAAKIGADASRKFAAEAQAKGVALLAQAGMKVTAQIDTKSFADAMASATPEYQKRFGADIIDQIQRAGGGS